MTEEPSCDHLEILPLPPDKIFAKVAGMRSPTSAPPPLPEDWVEGISKKLPIIQVEVEAESLLTPVYITQQKDFKTKRPKLVSRRKLSDPIEKEDLQHRRSPPNKRFSLQTNGSREERRYSSTFSTPPRGRTITPLGQRRRGPFLDKSCSNNNIKYNKNESEQQRSRRRCSSVAPPQNIRHDTSPGGPERRSSDQVRGRSMDSVGVGCSMRRRAQSMDSGTRIGNIDAKSFINRKHGSLLKTYSSKSLLNAATISSAPRMRPPPPSSRLTNVLVR